MQRPLYSTVPGLHIAYFSGTTGDAGVPAVADVYLTVLTVPDRPLALPGDAGADPRAGGPRPGRPRAGGRGRAGGRRRLLPRGPAAVRDLWAHKNMGTINGDRTEMVPAHGVVMLRLSHLVE